ncbi:VP7 [American grass carp reovirus]|uniref:Outer capsid protein VP7 n=1 Tax=Aquareovirus G (isolate American grass carp/USA/PB01-155/-) TaxID=648234 RepID=VP7_AQRVG|nr:VP7 [American grass carp reovirus]B2BNE9.1 RecName: Full=Outer capsid protein VP7 [American grass carp reovirus PB01-155]ABV01049.1 VP7 [American grass carp reovirus]
MPAHMIPQVARAVVQSTYSGSLSAIDDNLEPTDDIDQAAYITTGRYVVCALCLATVSDSPTQLSRWVFHHCSDDRRPLIRSMLLASSRHAHALRESREVDMRRISRLVHQADEEDELDAPRQARRIGYVDLHSCDLQNPTPELATRQLCNDPTRTHSTHPHLARSHPYMLPTAALDIDPPEPVTMFATMSRTDGVPMLFNMTHRNVEVLASPAARASLMYALLKLANAKLTPKQRSIMYGPSANDMVAACTKACAATTFRHVGRYAARVVIEE